MAQSQTLTIAPGVTIEAPAYNASLQINGTLLAQGTATDSIRFLGKANPQMSPTSTHGGTLFFNAGSSASVLDYVRIDQMGDISGGGNAISTSTSGLSIIHTTICNSEETGITNNASSLTISSSNIFGNSTGFYNTAGKPVLQNNRIYSNSTYGVNNVSSDTLDARNSYWGTPTGPFHAALNPNGTGNKVSNKVKFTPWVEQLTQVEQTITFAEISNKYVDETVVLTANATSDLPVSFSINTQPASGVAILTSNTLTFPGSVGQVNVTAYQAGNDSFKPAQIQRSFQVLKRSQNISFSSVAARTIGEPPFSLTATATSGLPVTFTVISGPATLNGNTLTLTAPGTVVIEARQPGNTVYNPATPQQQSFIVHEQRSDLAVRNVSSNRTSVGLNDVITVSWTIANEGIAASLVNWTERIYMQSPSGENRSLIKQVSFSTNSSLNSGQTIARSDALIIPAQLLIGDQAVFVVEVVPGSATMETPGTQTNNIAVQPNSWTIKKELSLVLSSSQITEGNVSGIMATVSRTGSLLNALTVTVSFNNAARFSFPTSVVIPVGQSGISFTVSVPNNNTVDGQATDRLQVSATGYQSNQTDLAIIDNDLPTLSITNLPATATEGQVVRFKVGTNLAPSSPLSVFLQSSNPTRFPVPVSVTITAGALTVDVSVTLVQDNIPEIDLAVGITAGASNHTPANQTIQINDDDIPGLALVLQTNSISESGGLSATQATLRRVTGSNSIAFTANLSANLPNTLILPGAISLAAGENEKTFTIGVIDNDQVDGQRLLAITASLFVSSCNCNALPTSSGSVSATLAVNDNDGPSLLLTVTQQTLSEGLSNAGILRITRNTSNTNALTVSLSSSDLTEATLPATINIPTGQSFVDVPITTLNDGATDGNQQVYLTATSSGFSSGSIWIIVTDQNKPDLQIPLVQLSGPSVQASSLLTCQVSIKNTGSATAPSGTLVRGYLSKDNVIDASDILISEDVLYESVPVGQIKILPNAIKVPESQGIYKILFWVNPDATLTELLFTNNVSQPSSLIIEPSYTANAVVGPAYFMQGSTIPITGSATKGNGSVAANMPVEVYVITQGIRRNISAVTDASGNYSTQFTPLVNESGHFIIGASSPSLNQTVEQDAFDILGIRINRGNPVKLTATLNETLSSALQVENRSGRNLTNFTLSPLTLPNGASVQFTVLPTLPASASANITYTISGSLLTDGNNFDIAVFQAKSDEGILQNTNIYYYCQASNGYLVTNMPAIRASVSQSSGERQIEIKLINKGKGSTGPINISLPKVNWLSSITAKTLSSLAPGDSTAAILKFLALNEVPFNYPITGNIGINSTSGNSFTIPFTFEKVSESSGTARITVTNQFTYYGEGGPKVKDALVKITNYFTGAVYAEGYTNAEGVFTAPNVPEGKHRITVEKDKHLPYSNVLEINPARTTESTVFLNYQAITFSWSVVPTAVQDQYEVVLESKFETNVPAPVVTMDMPKTMPQLSAGQDYPFYITLTNHGLITAEQVTLDLPTIDPEYEFVTNYTPADLFAKQSIQVPVVMRRRSGGGRVSALSNEAPCAGYVGTAYTYKCNLSTGLWDRVVFPFNYGGRNCGPGGGVSTTGGTISAAQYAALYDAWVAGMVAMGQIGAAILCPNCSGSSGVPSGGRAEPTPEVGPKKESCVECIAGVAGAVAGCLPGGDLVSPLICYAGVVLDGTRPNYGAELAKCAVDGIKGKVKDNLAKLVPGLSQLLCLKGILDELEKCKGTESSGGRKSAGELPNAVFQEISDNLQVVLKGYNGLRSWMSEYFGDMIDKEGWKVLFPLVKTYLNDLTPIPSTVQTNIIAAMAGYDIQPAALSAFFTRWNTSIEAKNNNVFAPNAQYPNIINWNQVDVYVIALITSHNQSVNKGFQTIDDMHKESIKSLLEIIDGQKNEVCASVTVQFNQKLTMTREAFEGTLEITNGHPTDAMKTISVNIQITDENGTPSNGLFEIQTKSLTNLANVTGSGEINGQQKGSVKYLFIPELGAAPTVPKIYKFGGSVTYWDPYAKAMITLPLVAVPITINPSPNLMLHYFMERNILGDDALTSPEIEPSVPAELAVMVENKGYGPAVNMVISSAQPKIVDNEKGLAINFNLIGSKLQGQPKQLGVTNINFGTIPALKTQIGQWYFTSSLLGKFVSYEAKVVHTSSFGNSNLSLVQGVKLHELTKSIRLYGNQDDGINDFLVNDIFDVADRPDIIYFSQGNRTAKVNPAASGSFNIPVSAPVFTTTLTVTPSDTGFNYIKLNDPGNRLYTLVSVTRSDGQIIPLDNAWLTFVTLPVSRAPIYENKFHLVDRFASTNPATYTVVWKPVNLNVPKVDSITGAPPQPASTQITNLKVYFNKRINPATFTYEDLSLTLQGGPNLINSSVVITQLDSASFNIDLSAITIGNGFYTLTAQAANVEDSYGISGTTGKQVSWSQFLNVPIVQAFQGIPPSHVASAYSTIQLLFNLPIDVSTITPVRFTIYKNGIQQAGSLTIESVSQDHKLVSLAGLQTILTQNGTYELRVDLPNIKSENQIAGLQTQSISLTVDNIGPTVLILEKSAQGGLDTQHIPFINISFNEGVVGLNTAAFQFSRNGETLPLSFTQLSNTNPRTWMVGNFGLLTYPEGTYTFTVNLAEVKDSTGNAGTGTRQITWTANRTSSIAITNLSVIPDLGFSSTDGITSGQSLTLSYNLNANASKVTISQVDLSGEVILSDQLNVVAGNRTAFVTVTTGGNTRIRVKAIGANGSTVTTEKVLYLDQIPLFAQWQFAQNQTLSTQVSSISLAVSSRLLNDAGLLNAIQLRRNGTLIPSTSLSVEPLNDTLYTIRGINTISSIAGTYQLTFDIKNFSKYSSGRTNSGTASVSWTVLSPNRPPVTNAGASMTIASVGTVRLNGTASVDPDGDVITYNWVAPNGVTLSNPTSATPSFTLNEADRGKTYSFLLITSDGILFSTDVVTVYFGSGETMRITNLQNNCINSGFQIPVGIPSGGTFSGPGISGNYFYPSEAGVGTHTITYTKNGQSVMQNVTVYPRPDLAISPTSSTLTCSNPAIRLLASSPDNVIYYGWRGPAGFIATGASISATVPGSYTVTANIGNSEWGCSNTATATVQSSIKGLFTTVKSGQWNDPTIWTCGVVPTTGNVVMLEHPVTLPINSTSHCKAIIYGTNGKIISSSGSKLRVGF
ncbi:PKD domain-containing protein [Spirosoma daeguense]